MFNCPNGNKYLKYFASSQPQFVDRIYFILIFPGINQFRTVLLNETLFFQPLSLAESQMTCVPGEFSHQTESSLCQSVSTDVSLFESKRHKA